MTLLEKYQIEAAEDITVDETNIREKQLLLPGIKHKWVARLINSKRTLSSLEKQRERAIDAVVDKIKLKTTVAMSNNALNTAASKHETVEKIRDEIDEYKSVIEYLEKLEKVLSSMTWDFKNATDLIKMETM